MSSSIPSAIGAPALYPAAVNPAEEIDAPPPPLPAPAEPAPVGLAAGAAAPPENAPAALPFEQQALMDAHALLAAERTDAWALKTCTLLEQLEQQPQLLANSAELLEAADQLVNAAYADCSFCHCYLSVAEELSWTITTIKKKMAAAGAK